MKNTIVTIAAMMAVTLGASAQTDNSMNRDTVHTALQRIENGVTSGYQAIEDGVVGGYTKMQDGIVKGFTRVSDAFIMKFFARNGETLEQAKERMKAEEEKLRQKNHELINLTEKSINQ